MRSWSGLLVGVVGLAVLDGVVSSQQGSSNVGGALAGAGSLVRKFLDPTVPFFTTTPKTTSTSTTSATTSGLATTAAWPMLPATTAAQQAAQASAGPPVTA